LTLRSLYIYITTLIDEVLILWQHKLPRMVHRLNFSPHQNRKSNGIQTAVKMKLIFSQLVAHYLEGVDIVRIGEIRVQKP
jgi:hypothetical protein